MIRGAGSDPFDLTVRFQDCSRSILISSQLKFSKSSQGAETWSMH